MPRILQIVIHLILPATLKVNVPIIIFTLEIQLKEGKPRSLNFPVGALTLCNIALANVTKHFISLIQTTNCFQTISFKLGPCQFESL